MRIGYLGLLFLFVAGCTLTHKVELVTTTSSGMIAWQQSITERVNDLMGCLTLAQLQCVDAAEAKRR